MFCKFCKYTNKNGDRFCSQCGKPLASVPPPLPATPTPPPLPEQETVKQDEFVGKSTDASASSGKPHKPVPPPIPNQTQQRNSSYKTGSSTASISFFSGLSTLAQIDKLRIAIAVAILILITVLTINLVQTISHLNQVKGDLNEINNIKYGLFNSDVWVDEVSRVIAKKIDEFQVTTENKEQLKEAISQIIDKVIVTIDNVIRQKNTKCDGSGLGGLIDCGWGHIKQGAIDVFADLREVRAHVPQYTDLAFEYLNQPGAKEEIKRIIKQKLKDVAATSFSHVDMSQFNSILARYTCKDRAQCQELLTNNINALDRSGFNSLLWILALTVLLFAILILKTTTLTKYHVWILLTSCLLLLLGGVFTPMIEIEAKIAELSFDLMGETITFSDQVIYYQNKSIGDVVTTLLADGKPRMVMVAMLVATFSIIFPISKLISSFVYFHNIQGLRDNKLVKFFTFKSGKWSMADVFIVAIFLAAIGFDGIITNQLSQLGELTKQLTILTSGGSQLLVGFYLFLGFCISSLIISSSLEPSNMKVTS